MKAQGRRIDGTACCSDVECILVRRSNESRLANMELARMLDQSCQTVEMVISHVMLRSNKTIGLSRAEAATTAPPTLSFLTDLDCFHQQYR